MIASIILLFKVTITVLYVGILLMCIVYLSYIFIPIILLSVVAGGAYISFKED